MSGQRQWTSAALWHALSLVFIAQLAYAARHDGSPPADPFADPKHDPFNPLKYIASNTLSAIGVALTLTVALIHTWMTFKIGAKFMLPMVIAEYTYALGIATRFGLHKHPDSSGLYIVEYLFVTLSPCGFIAAEYVLLGRLSRLLGGDKHMLVRPQRVTLVFVLSDVTTFLIQAAGGSISASAHTSEQKAETGSRIFLTGIALQFVSFLFFTVLYFRFLWRMRKYEPEIWVQDAVAGKPWWKDWRSLAGAMVISCIGVLVRSVYRTVELSEGFQGFLTITEVFFYVLDFVPLIIALAIYIPFWPGRYIRPNALAATTDGEQGHHHSADEGTLQDVPMTEKKN